MKRTPTAAGLERQLERRLRALRRQLRVCELAAMRAGAWALADDLQACERSVLLRLEVLERSAR